MEIKSASDGRMPALVASSTQFKLPSGSRRGELLKVQILTRRSQDIPAQAMVL
jgi:hypothetical protein